MSDRWPNANACVNRRCKDMGCETKHLAKRHQNGALLELRGNAEFEGFYLQVNTSADRNMDE